MPKQEDRSSYMVCTLNLDYSVKQILFQDNKFFLCKLKMKCLSLK